MGAESKPPASIVLTGPSIPGRIDATMGPCTALTAAQIRSIASVYSTDEVDDLLAGIDLSPYATDADVAALAAATSTALGLKFDKTGGAISGSVQMGSLANVFLRDGRAISWDSVDGFNADCCIIGIIDAISITATGGLTLTATVTVNGGVTASSIVTTGDATIGDDATVGGSLSVAEYIESLGMREFSSSGGNHHAVKLATVEPLSGDMEPGDLVPYATSDTSVTWKKKTEDGQTAKLTWTTFVLWSPSDLDDLVQLFLDATPEYYASTVGGLPILTPEEDHGDVAQPRGQRCVLFDGTDDYLTRGARLTTAGQTALTVSCRLKSPTGTNIALCGEWGTTFLFNFESGVLKVYIKNGAGSYVTSVTPSSTSGWHTYAFVFNGIEVKIYIDGVQQSVSHTGTCPAGLDASDTTAFRVGSISGTWFLNGSMSDLRVYSTAKTAAELLAISNQEDTPTTIDRTGLVAAWWLNEEAGTTHYDWSGNGKNLTATGVTTSTYHATDSGVTYNPANHLGHSVVVRAPGDNTLSVKFPLSTPRTNVTVQYEAFIDSSETAFVFLGDASSGAVYAGAAESGSAASIHTGAGTPTYTIDGVAFSGTTRNQLYAATPRGQWVTIKISALNLSTWSSIYIGYGSGNFDLAGLLRNFKIDYTSDATWDAESNDGTTNGFSLSSTSRHLILPRNEATPTLDTSGATLGVDGPVSLPAVLEVPCITGNGTNVAVALGTGLIPATTADWSVEFWYYHSSNGSTNQRIFDVRNSSSTDILVLQTDANAALAYTPGSLFMYVHGGGSGAGSTAVAGVLTNGAWHRIVFARSGTAYSATVYSAAGTSLGSTSNTRASAHVASMYTVLLGGYSGPTPSTDSPASGRMVLLSVTTGGVTKYFPLQEGPGTSNTNRTVYWVADDGTSGTVANAIVNGTVSTIWANRTTGTVKDWCVQYGGRLTSQNLVLYSSDYTNAYWTKGGFTVTLDQTGPTGVVELSTLNEGTGNVTHVVSRGPLSATTIATYCASFHMRTSSRRYALVGFDDGVNGIFVIVDTQDWTVTNASAGGTYVGSGVTSLGDGLYRVWVSGALTGTSLTLVCYGNDSSSVVAVTYTGTSSTLIVGAVQFEQGSSPTAYHATTATALTTSGNVFIPGRISGSLAADGNALTLDIGNHGNPYSRLLPNYWSAPELVAIGYTSATKLAPSDPVQSIAPVDSKFRRYGVTGADRYIATRAAQSDTSDPEAYVQ